MSTQGENWSRPEVEAAVDAYFRMLRDELAGSDYSKAVRRRELQPLLRDRSEGSIEFKHGNISSVLLDLGYPYIDGYKPYPNRQELLVEVVQAWLERHPQFADEVEQSRLLNPAEPPDPAVIDLARIFEDPPTGTRAPFDEPEPWKRGRGTRVDLVQRDLDNRKLGHAGEEFVVELERRRLAAAGRDDLARRIEWVTHTRGRGLGFDVLSWEERDESERFLSVKTTGAGKHFPFCVTAPEVKTSEGTGAQFALYRVFRFGRRPGVYVLRGSLVDACRLEARVWRAIV